MGAVQRNYFVHISVIEITLNILTRNDAAHGMPDEDVAGRQLAVEVGVLADRI